MACNCKGKKKAAENATQQQAVIERRQQIREAHEKAKASARANAK